ncbi:hypothetical protein A7U60_g2990 [Sanghuangporus baumii]|uniref:Late embryogenesis abundant protein LEA-2 subgroup domain-containing protein n=1 Tax=Sanghuangporus baumii TaxID=108892 RepID=A0A9Q5NDH0_SANBA|nr:hypothetical protein A7U60_g2990 [Sanghuangporus baumii]
MSYQDPYYAPQHARPYTDAPVDYDPYNTRQQHPTYDQSGYQDDDAYRNTGFGGDDGVGHTREKSRYEETFPPVFRPPKSTGAIRIWRKDNRGPLWTKGGRGKCCLRFFCCSVLIFLFLLIGIILSLGIGGRGKCCLRFFCCSVLIFLFLLIGIILSLGIWIRPPDITINEVGLNSTGGSAAQFTSSSLSINFAVNISVENPNYFDVDFKKIKANLTYPLNDMDLGGGEKDGITFKSHTQTTFNFPFTLTYDLESDSNQVVLKDLLSKCGFTGTKEDITVDYKITVRRLFLLGFEDDDSNQVVLKDLLSKCGFTGTKEDITVDYKITLGIKIIVITISPTFSSSFSFECPTSDIESFLESSGIDISSITDALSG